MPKRAILYARVSGDDRKNATSSIEGQLAECRQYAVQRGYNIVGEALEDPDKQTSGADWLPELDRLIRLAPSGTFEVLVCREVDRLARNRFKQLATEIELENHGVRVEYVIGQFEDTDEGRLLKGLVSEFAEFERSKIRRRTHNGKLRSIEAGNVMIGGSVAPYGYDIALVNECRTLAINKQEAEVVRMIFGLYGVKMLSIGEIAEYLDAHKVPLPSKGNNHRKISKLPMWSTSTIAGLLDQETYLGRWHYRKTRTIKDPKTGKTRNVPRPRDEWMEITVPAIITEELFAAAQKRKTANKIQKGRQRKHEYTLGGMVRCGHCHSTASGMTKYDRGRAYAYYRCNVAHMPRKFGSECNNILYRVDRVDASVWSWITSLLLEPTVLRQALEDYQKEQSQRTQPQLSMLESTQARMADLEAQRTRLVEAYSKGVLSLDELASQKTSLDKEIGDLAQAVALLRSETEPHLLTEERVETIEGIAKDMRDSVLELGDDLQTKRAIFQLLDVQVKLSFDGKQRWVKVECTLGSANCAVENTTSWHKRVNSCDILGIDTRTCVLI